MYRRRGGLVQNEIKGSFLSMVKNTVKEEKVKHTWRDSVFRYLFKEEVNFVQMYEIFSGRKLLPEDVEFRDTDSIVLSKDLKNDISFIDKNGNFIVLVEHQHTKCPNIGLRMLIYYGELLKMYVKKHELNIYGTVPIPYPKAEFYVAYTGSKEWDDDDMTIVAGDVHIKVKMVNINYDKLAVKRTDNTLSGYAYLLHQFECYRSDGEAPRIAVDRAFKACREKGYLMDYINREEFLAMVTERWTVEQQFIDRERWAREEERAKAQQLLQAEKIATIKGLLENGVSLETIAASLNLSVEEVVTLQSQSQD